MGRIRVEEVTSISFRKPLVLISRDSPSEDNETESQSMEVQASKRLGHTVEKC